VVDDVAEFCSETVPLRIHTLSAKASRWWQRVRSRLIATPSFTRRVSSYVAVGGTVVNRRRLRISWVTAVCALALALCQPVAAAESPLRLLLLGDSLMAGYGLPHEQGFPARLSAALDQRGEKVVLVEASVSGDTTAGGRARLAWALGGAPNGGVDAAIVELGANDGLRGLPPSQIRANLTAILDELKTRHIPVLLAGMRAPPNLGDDYGREYNAVFADLARSYEDVYYPFFLDGVVLRPELNQADGLHPNAAGVDIVVARIRPSVEELLKRAVRTPSTASSPPR
jgi:acyl-CoA thioesterase-1